MFDEPTATLGGDVKEKPAVKKPKSRAQRIADWRKKNAAAYGAACMMAHCTCTPTRAQMLLFKQWESPPVD